jgi:transcriptional regulator with XRE-family HTH domain
MNTGVDSIIASRQIKRLREQRGISQEQAADAIGVSRPFYALIEQGLREPTLSQLVRLSDLLGTRVTDITTGIEAGSSIPIDYGKFKDLVMACIKYGADSDGKITKTKLAKLVYFSDFTQYFYHKKSITNALYRCIPRGPVADDYFRAIDELYEEQAIVIEPKGPALMISAVEDVTSSRLSSEELELVRKIGEKWQGKSTDSIVEFTHRQSPWREALAGAFIPYDAILGEPVDNLY